MSNTKPHPPKPLRQFTPDEDTRPNKPVSPTTPPTPQTTQPSSPDPVEEPTLAQPPADNTQDLIDISSSDTLTDEQAKTEARQPELTDSDEGPTLPSMRHKTPADLEKISRQVAQREEQARKESERIHSPRTKTRPNPPVSNPSQPHHSLGSAPSTTSQPNRPREKTAEAPSRPRSVQKTASTPTRRPRPINEVGVQQTPSFGNQPTVRITPVKRWWRIFVRSLSTLSILVILAVVFGAIGSVMAYFSIASQLPPANELRARASQFATTEILDRNGNLLWEIIDPNGGRRTNVTLNEIAPELIEATIATEDRFFYLNVGVDPIAIARAVYYNYQAGETVSGASTITQQLARNVLLTDERFERSYLRKIREAVLAVEISRRYSKQDILEIYLNQIYYGNMAYGIEAAAQTYFDKSAANLTLPEASLLAGLPQSPAVHDPFTNPDGAKARRADVLRLMAEAGYISPVEAQIASETEPDYATFNFSLNAPHFVTYVRQELEGIVGTDYIYKAGLQVQTTLDPQLQTQAEAALTGRIDELVGYNVSNGALVAMDAQTGEILAMVGSKDFYNDAISGQVNMATTPRQVGSTIKPLVFLATFEQLAWTPSRLIMDVPVTYPGGGGTVYQPLNYDRKFHGPVSVRSALANSYNIPAVKALERIGLPALQEISARLGINTLTRDDYGLALALGSGETPLIQMTNSYQAIANNGILVPATAIMKITDRGREIVPARKQPRQVLSPQHAYLMSDILADQAAREPAFGRNTSLNLSRPAAAKSGTTNDFRDSWTIGYTPQIVTGVWLGNANNTPMDNISGSSGAGVVWNRFMELAHQALPVEQFSPPPGIIQLEVCADSGTIPSQVCPETRVERFWQNQPPLGPEEDIHQFIAIDRNSGLRANEFCQSNVDQRYYRVYPLDGRDWALSLGINQPPTEFCPAAQLVADITSPANGDTVAGTISVFGQAIAANFASYQVELGVGTSPQLFVPIYGPNSQPVNGGTLATFDTLRVENGPYTLRLIVTNQNGHQQEARVQVLISNALPTSTPSPTGIPIMLDPTATPTPLPTLTPTPPIPTSTPLAPTPIPPTDTPNLQLPTNTPTLTPVPVDENGEPIEAPPVIIIAPQNPEPTATSDLGLGQ